MKYPDSLKLENQVCFALYRATNALIKAYKPYLLRLDLTYPQYLVMLCLWQQDQIPIKILADKTSMEPAQLTPLIKRLESKKIIKRVRDANDERLVMLTLTLKGQRLQQKAETIPESLRCLVQLSDQELGQLKRLAEKTCCNLRLEGDE